MNENSSFLDQVMLYAGMALTWLTGEVGRNVIAGAAGGAVRWFATEKRRLRDGVFSVIAGVVFAQYGTPLVLAVIEKFIGPLGEGAQVRDTAAFAAGILGMSMAKLIMAMGEFYTTKAKRRGDDDV